MNVRLPPDGDPNPRSLTPVPLPSYKAAVTTRVESDEEAPPPSYKEAMRQKYRNQ